MGDICKPSSIESAFEGVDCVFHMAAYINFDFPPNRKELERVNVDGTQIVVDLCRKYSVPRLVYTSDCLIHMTPYLGKANFTIVCNQTEPKTKVPQRESEFQIPGYAQSKYKGEVMVLEANGSPLANGGEKGFLGYGNFIKANCTNPAYFMRLSAQFSLGQNWT